MNLEKPTCGPGQVQRLDTSHGRVGDGPNLSPSQTGSWVAPVPSWIFPPQREPGSHEAGFSCLSRPVTNEVMPCVCTRPSTHTTAASISTPDASSSTSTTTLADSVELFGTASVVILACHCREMRCRRKNHPGTPSDHPVRKSQSMIL